MLKNPQHVVQYAKTNAVVLSENKATPISIWMSPSCYTNCELYIPLSRTTSACARTGPVRNLD